MRKNGSSDYVGLRVRAPIHTKLQGIAYDVFFHDDHPSGSVHKLSEEKFTEHWRKEGLLDKMNAIFRRPAATLF